MTAKIARGRKGAQVQRERAGSWDKATRGAFLAHLSVTLNVSASCRKVKRCPQGLYKLKKRDAGFRTDMSQVIADAYEQMELKYLERGVHGSKRPVFQGGAKVGEIIEYPDRVALTLLRAHRETAIAARLEVEARKDELALAKIRLAEKLSEMNRRMGGEG